MASYPAIQAASYDSARSTRLNERHWAIGPQVSDPTPEQRETLRNRSRYEIANNSLLEGMVETYGRDLVGSGPHPTFREFGEARRELQSLWNEWAYSIKLGPLCKTIARSFLVDGEVFVLAIDEPPYVRLIEPERIRTPIGKLGQQNWSSTRSDVSGWNPAGATRTAVIEGIKYIEGVAAEYYVDDELTYSADVMSHVYQQKFANQRRGVPRAAPALDMFAAIRRVNGACVLSYEAVAKIAMVLQAKMLTPQVSGTPFDVVDLVNGSALVLPDGYELGQVKAEHPSASHREAISMFVNEAARCFPMPLNKALGTSQDSNFASGSLDNIDYERAIESDQVLFDCGLVQRLTSIFLLVHGQQLRRCFVGWDAIPHLNPEKQYSAIQTKLQLRLTSRTREAAKLGADWDDINEELEREEKAMGLPKQVDAPGDSQGAPSNALEDKNGQPIPNDSGKRND